MRIANTATLFIACALAAQASTLVTDPSQFPWAGSTSVDFSAASSALPLYSANTWVAFADPSTWLTRGIDLGDGVTMSGLDYHGLGTVFTTGGVDLGANGSSVASGTMVAEMTGSNQDYSELDFFFDSPVSAAGIFYDNYNPYPGQGGIELEVFRGGTQEVFSLAADRSNQFAFAGVSDGVNDITGFALLDHAGAVSSGIAFDRVADAPAEAPEPGAAWLMSAGGGLLALGRLRRRG
jgi:hypothetical protein